MRNHLFRALTTTLLCAAVTLPAVQSEASMLKFWVGVRGDYFDVGSDLLNSRDSGLAAGGDVGIEIMGITLFGEVLWLDQEQFLFTLNGGVDFDFGDTVRLSLGAFTGPMFFLFPNAETSGGTDLSALSATDQQTLLQAGGFSSLEQAEAEFNVFSEQEEDLGRMAFGWNLIRARAAVDVGVVGPLRLGVAGQIGYHLLITGEDAAAGAKNEAIDQYVADNNLPAELISPLRSAVGAKPVDEDNLSGLNYDVNLYLRLEF